MDTVSELMTPEPITVATETPIGRCAALILQHRFRHLPVVDPDGVLVGVVHDMTVFHHGHLSGDTPRRWIPRTPDDASRLAKDIALPVEIVVHPDDALLPVLARATRDTYDVAMVVDEGSRPIGILTEHDAVRLAQALIPPTVLTGAEATRAVQVVQASDPAVFALSLMYRHRFRHVAVVESESLAGVLSFRDLVAHAVDDHPEITAGGIAGERPVHTAAPDAPLQEVARCMAEHKIGCVPLVDAGRRVKGIVTRTDVLHALIVALEHEVLFDDGEAR